MVEKPDLPGPIQGVSTRRDTLALGLLLVTFVLVIGLFVWVAASYDTLPDLLPLHFDAQGNPDRIAERREVYVLPAIALVVAVMNGLVGWFVRSRFGMVFAAHLIWAGAL